MTTKKSVWVLFGILVLSAWVLGSAIQVGAETMKFRVTTYLIHFEFIPVGDVEGHIVGTFSRRGMGSYENGDTSAFQNWGTLDMTKGKGTFQGYGKHTFEDGSTTLAKLEGMVEPGPKGLSFYKGTGEYFKGTGRFEGITGSMTYTGKALTPYSKEKGLWGDVYYDITSTYTLPRK